MLNQNADPTQTSAAQPRVTPAELSTALAAIEARRQAEAGMIPIDQAVSELHLDSTSDEIWAEVQRQRAAAASRIQPPPVQTAPPQAAVSPVRIRTRRQWRGLIAVPFILFGLSQMHVIPHIWGSPTHGSAAAPILRPLAAVPDGQDVYADDVALIQISEGKPAAQITVSRNDTGNRWPLVKMRGHVYLHGYIANTASLSPLQGKALNIYNDDNSGELDGESTSKITLRVDDVPLQNSGGGDGYSEVTAPNFQPDPLTTLNDWY